MSKNKAFTLPEILIALSIVGVTMVLGYSAFRNYQDKTISRSYAKAYLTLRTACFNIQHAINEHNKNANFEAQRNGLAQAAADDLKHFPNFRDTVGETEEDDNTVNENVRTLCNNLENFINNKGSNLSNSIPDGVNSSRSLQFTASDGMIYYVSKDMIDDKFYVVWVDINGKSRPNTISARNTRYPDIVPFLVHADYGEVIPAGYPAHCSHYGVARVLYSKQDMDRAYSDPLTFYKAQYSAYNGVSYALDPFSQTYSLTDFDDTLPSGFSKNSGSHDHTNCPGTISASSFPSCTVEFNTKI